MEDDSLRRFHFAFLPGVDSNLFRAAVRRDAGLASIYANPLLELALLGAPSITLAPEIDAFPLVRADLEDCLDLFRGAGVEVLYSDSPNLPRRLESSRKQWSCITALGDLAIVDAPRMIGVVGRREASGETLEAAHTLAAKLADQGVPTISGMARGIDRAAHLGSLEGGGCTVGAMPMGMARFMARRAREATLHRACDEGRLLVLSTAPPRQGWTLDETMRRNRWIAEWCDALVVVDAGDKGGTWRTAQYAAKLGKPIWVATGFQDPSAASGNELLARKLGGQTFRWDEAPEGL